MAFEDKLTMKKQYAQKRWFIIVLIKTANGNIPKKVCYKTSHCIVIVCFRLLLLHVIPFAVWLCQIMMFDELDWH